MKEKSCQNSEMINLAFYSSLSDSLSLPVTLLCAHCTVLPPQSTVVQAFAVLFIRIANIQQYFLGADFLSFWLLMD